MITEQFGARLCLKSMPICIVSGLQEIISKLRSEEIGNGLSHTTKCHGDIEEKQLQQGN